MSIFQRGDWVKVANRTNGATGWVFTGKKQPNHHVLLQQHLHQLLAQHQHIVEVRHRANIKFADILKRLNAGIMQTKKELNASHAPMHSITQHHPQMTPHESFDEMSWSYNGKGNKATVHETYLGKDGKIHHITRQIPLKKAQKISF